MLFDTTHYFFWKRNNMEVHEGFPVSQHVLHFCEPGQGPELVHALVHGVSEGFDTVGFEYVFVVHSIAWEGTSPK